MADPFLVLSSEDVASCLDRIGVGRAVELVEGVFRSHGEGRAIMPPKLHLDLEPAGIHGWMNAMPAYIAPGNLMSIKWVGGFSDNPSIGLPYIVGMLVLADARTGLAVGIMEAGQITSLRTGAAVAVAAKYLAVPGPLTVGLVGAGTQGRSALRALSCVVEIEAVRITDASKSLADRTATEFRDKLPGKVVSVSSPQEAVKGAHLIIAATPADEPLVRGEHVMPGALVVTVGSHRETDNAVFEAADKVVVDKWYQAEHRGTTGAMVSDGVLTRESLWGELGDIVAGKLPGRQRADERIVCTQVGMGSEDLAIASQVYKMAMEAGMGTRCSGLLTVPPAQEASGHAG